MKVKEVNLTANIVWAPVSVSPTYLACGTSAQQLDASFNSSSVLQLYDLNLADTSLDMKLAGSLAVPDKFHQLLWHSNVGGKFDHPLGLLVGGCENGAINIYSPGKLLQKEKPLLLSLEGKHKGPVRALDFSFQQSCLLASGSSNCEIFIWDINDTSAPMTPGQKPDLVSDVTSIGWNQQVGHIMAATYGGRCVVYDLRKGSSIIQISESISQIKSHNVCWDPSVATRLIVSSNDDTTPIAQVWDLRYAASPVSKLEGHQRGIAKMQWCPEDPDLFITCGKDNRILVWNPNTSLKGGEIVGEFPAYNQWSFDLAWCRKDPSLVATATIDSYVSVYSLLGAGSPPNQTSKFSAIADSFPGMEMPSELPLAPSNAPIQLKKPPKWFARRSGACFGFGGRLVSWDSDTRQIKVSQVVTEPEFLSKSEQLDNTLGQGDLKGHCFSKSQQATTENDRTLWSFLGASFDSCSRTQFTQLLGFHADEVAKKVRPHTLEVDVQQLTDRMSDLPVGSTTSTSSLDPAEQFEMIASTNSASKTPEVVGSPDLVSGQEKLSLKIGDDPEGQLRHALLLGDFQSAVEVCLKESNYSLALIFAAEFSSDLFEKTKERVLQHQCQNRTLVKFILKKRLDDLVASCKLEDWKAALVAVLNYADPQELTSLSEALGERLEASGSKVYLEAALLCFICAGNLDKFASGLSRANPDCYTSPIVLQEVVELLIVLQKALASSGRSIATDHQGATNNILNNYASLLASQGALNRAVTYLGNNLQGDVALLKERVTKALGHSTSNRMRMLSTSSTQSSIRRTSTPMAYQNQPPIPTMNPSMQPAPQSQFFSPSTQPPQPTPMMNPVSSYPSFQQSVPAPPQFGGFQPSTPAMVPSMPPAGPPPTDKGNVSFGARKTGASRYVSATPSAPSNMWTPRPTMAAPNTSFVPPPMTPQQPGSYNSQILPGGPPLQDTLNAPQEQAPGLPPPAAFDPNVPRGWNDPPPLSASRKAKQQKPTPVASPGIVAMQPSDPNAVGQFTPSMSQSYQNTGFSSFSGPPKPNNATTAGAPPTLPVEKGPIPVEHQELKDVFDVLRAKGISMTANPSAKQRLEDLGPKLENLYDKLREGRISRTTTDGLHRIVSLIKAGDYHQALMTHSTTISSGNFSEMASFMPALKMLLTTCMQCQVFL